MPSAFNRWDRLNPLTLLLKINEMSLLIILGSARKDSHTRTMLQNTFDATPHELIDLLDHKINAFDYGTAYQKDDQFRYILEKMEQADHIIFATPVYWYAMSGIMKNFFDRFTDLLSPAFKPEINLSGKRMFLFAVAPSQNFHRDLKFHSSALRHFLK